jgi:dipeptidase D
MKPANFPQYPEHLWNVFYDFTQTPRPSKKEGKIRDYLVSLAEDNDLAHVIDEAGNIVIYVPGRNGRENDEAVLIQNHIDMVTDALRDKLIDFTTDPIETLVDNGWLTADGTTLGADNGIGCAAALAVIFEKDIVHPPLELLFTVDEETGLNGALGLEVKNLSAKKMINLDTEEWGSLYIGCAGGIDYEFNRDFELTEQNSEFRTYKVQVDGFLGGHSGVDIHEQRGNAVKFLIEFLDKIYGEAPFELIELRAGKAHNIIPRDGFAIINIKTVDTSIFQQYSKAVIEKWKSFCPKADQSFDLHFEQVDNHQKTLNTDDTRLILDFLTLFPHGAHSYDLEARDIVSMSNNLARVLVVGGKFYTQSSLRFFDREEVKSLERQLQVLSKVYAISAESHSEYPSWKPERENKVLDLVKKCYKELFSTEPKVTAIHAGLECGILRDKIGPLDVVSFGPTITGAHSPDERVNIESVAKFWELFKRVLSQI